MNGSPATRSAQWKWWVCGLLLLASAINYMDRMTLASVSTRIGNYFAFKQEQYGTLELGFGWAFAVGSLIFGVLADRLPLRWLYPAILAAWSGVGFATGWAENYQGLLVCRTLLGFFEAGHWPCAIKATQRLLEAKDRTMGNSLLQSGASFGAVLTPLILSQFLTDAPASWRPAFQLIGLAGLVWIIFWFILLRKKDLQSEPHPEIKVESVVERKMDWSFLISRRMWVVLFVITLINTSWQLLRAWLPKFLQEGRGYPEETALYFTSLYYVATDVGCIAAGALSLWFVRGGLTIHKSRRVTFALFAVMSTFTIAVPFLPRGPLLLGVLLVVGAGALGVFPVYHALSQDISKHHQGKITGLAGVFAWALGSPAQKYYGRMVDQTKSFDLGLALAGTLPLIALAVLWCFWDKKSRGDVTGTAS